MTFFIKKIRKILMKLKALLANKTPLLNTIDVRKRLSSRGDLRPKFGGGACEINTQRLKKSPLEFCTKHLWMRYTRQLTPYLKYNPMFCDPPKSSISYIVWLILVNKLLFWACFMRCMSKVLHSSDERFVLVLSAILTWWFYAQWWCPWRFHIMCICLKGLYSPCLPFSSGA